ncbi:MAG: sugar phosphate isomerase/epimerase family protein [Tepidisphaerales bacterium]
MNTNRREFLALSAAAGIGLAGAHTASAAMKTTLHKAMIIGKVDEKALTPLKAAGFEGVETTAIVPAEEAAKGKEIAEKMGMRVHSLLRGWAEFNNKDEAKAAKTLELTEAALKAAGGYGADTVLLVPCRIGGMPMPEAWEFKIEFDDKTGHVTKVVEGDNTKFQAYIDAHNHAIDTSTVAVKKLIPTAEAAKVVIALENVWNNLWVKPAIYQHFVASFKSPWVKSYFDIGNHVKYAPPQEWIKTLGSLIAKCHVKDFKLNPDGHGGKFVHPRDGSIDWPAVRAALDDVGYNGWLSIEDGGLPLEEFNKRIDLIIAGK